MTSKGRKRNITGTGESLEKRGEGLRSGSVGNAISFAGRFATILISLSKASERGKTKK